MARRRGRPTRAEAEAAGQLRMTLDTALDAAAIAHGLTRAVRQRKRHASSRDDQLRLQLFSDVNRDMHAVNVALVHIARQLETYREALSLAA